MTSLQKVPKLGLLGKNHPHEGSYPLAYRHNTTATAVTTQLIRTWSPGRFIPASYNGSVIRALEEKPRVLKIILFKQIS